MQVKDVSTYLVLKYQHERSEANKNWLQWGDNPKIPFTYERFPNIPEKVVFRKMEKLAEQGYLEYGVSLRTAWLTEKGKKYLEENHD